MRKMKKEKTGVYEN